MREAQDQPSYVACEPGPGSPASLLAGPWSHIQGRPQNLFLQKKKKKNLGTHTKKAQFRSQQGPWVLFCYFCIKARPHPYTQGTSAGFEVHCILDAGQTGTQEGFSGPRNWSSCCASLPLMGQASRFLPFIPRVQHASSPKLLLT